MPHFPMEGRSIQSHKGVEDEASQNARIKIKDRRRRYLEMHPEYFDAHSLELVDPLLYDRLVRRFQSAAERETDGRIKGYSGKIEADLMRSEAKIQALAHPDPNKPLIYKRDARGTIIAVDQNEEDRPKSKEDGIRKWRECMEQRFLRGEDSDFDYLEVDRNPRYDDMEEVARREQELYFDGQQEENDSQGRLEGETGVQDF